MGNVGRREKTRKILATYHRVRLAVLDVINISQFCGYYSYQAKDSAVQKFPRILSFAYSIAENESPNQKQCPPVVSCLRYFYLP